MNILQIGEWKYSVATNKTQGTDITLSVQSQVRKEGQELLQTTSWISYLPDNNSLSFDPKQKITLFAEVVRGRAPVLGANVVATLERPQSATIKVPLYDNGMGKLHFY